MALLSKALRSTFFQPYTRKVRGIKIINQVDAPDFSDDSDEGTRQGPVGTPSDPPPPGINFQVPKIPATYFYDIAGYERPRVPQPSYVKYPYKSQTWHIFNASAQPLGRMASRISQLLQGKHSPFYSHSIHSPEEFADFVVVVNGKSPMIMGAKGKVKVYRSHSGYPGGLKELSVRHVIQSYHWDRVVKQAVSGMLPKNNLRRHYMNRLKVYPDLYHDLDFIPQLQLRDGPDPNVDLGFNELENSNHSKITFASDITKIPERFKHLKYEPEPLDDPEYNPPNVPEKLSKKQENKLRAYYRKLRRHRVYNHVTKQYEI